MVDLILSTMAEVLIRTLLFNSQGRPTPVFFGFLLAVLLTVVTDGKFLWILLVGGCAITAIAVIVITLVVWLAAAIPTKLLDN